MLNRQYKTDPQLLLAEGQILVNTTDDAKRVGADQIRPGKRHTQGVWIPCMGRTQPFRIYQVLPKLIELWGLNVKTDVEAKKNFTGVSGK